MFIRGAQRPFGEPTAEDASARAAELRQVSGWGPTMRVAPVARAWHELASEMQRAGAATVSQLDPALLAPLARRMWVLMPDDPIMRRAKPVGVRLTPAGGDDTDRQDGI